MEFQAIVLAGGLGSRMTDLTSNIPKCLLPIGNKPMIWYPIRMLEKAGFNEINIITLDSIKDQVEKELKNNHEIEASLNIVGIDDNNEDDDYGTANSLYLLKEKITKDCMIVSCDLISNVNIQMMANFYRANNSSLVMLLSDNVEQSLEYLVPGSKDKYKPERDIIALDTESHKLIYFGPDIKTSKEIKLKSSLIQKYPKITWTNKFQDGHFYILKHWVIEYIFANKKMISLKTDLIPYLVKKQFSSHRHLLKEQNSETAFPIVKKKNPKIFDFIRVDELRQIINKASTSIDTQYQDLISCHVFLQAEGFCFRANNAAIFAEANRQTTGKILQYFLTEKNETVKKYDKNQVSLDSLVGEETSIGEKVTIKRSIIGKNCVIGARSKIANSIIMNNVKICEDTNIQNSVICSDCILNEKLQLKDCLVAYEQDLSAECCYTNETIKYVESFMDD